MASIHPGDVPDDASLPFSILPPEDEDEAICPEHGNMEKQEPFFIKNENELWVPGGDRSVFLCYDCIRQMESKSGVRGDRILAAMAIKNLLENEDDELEFEDFFERLGVKGEDQIEEFMERLQDRL